MRHHRRLNDIVSFGSVSAFHVLGSSLSWQIQIKSEQEKGLKNNSASHLQQRLRRRQWKAVLEDVVRIHHLFKTGRAAFKTGRPGDSSQALQEYSKCTCICRSVFALLTSRKRRWEPGMTTWPPVCSLIVIKLTAVTTPPPHTHTQGRNVAPFQVQSGAETI